MIKKFTYLNLILLCVTFITGCATTAGYRKEVDYWEGKNIDSLVKKRGLPNNIISISNGHKVYEYENTKMVYHSTYCTNNDCMPDFFNESCTTWFEINDKNIIQHVSFRGKDCIADD